MEGPHVKGLEHLETSEENTLPYVLHGRGTRKNMLELGHIIREQLAPDPGFLTPSLVPFPLLGRELLPSLPQRQPKNLRIADASWFGLADIQFPSSDDITLMFSFSHTSFGPWGSGGAGPST